MTRDEYNDLNSDGAEACPDCGFKNTVPRPGCHCPSNRLGFGTRHINEYHHNCHEAMKQNAPRELFVGRGGNSYFHFADKESAAAVPLYGPGLVAVYKLDRFIDVTPSERMAALAHTKADDQR